MSYRAQFDTWNLPKEIVKITREVVDSAIKVSTMTEVLLDLPIMSRPKIPA